MTPSARLLGALQARRGAVLGVAAALLLLAAAGIFRLDVRQDVASLVTDSDGDADRAFRDAAQTLAAFGTLDTLMVEVSAVGEPVERGKLEAAADQVAAHLRETGRFAAVHFRVAARERDKLFEVLFPRRFQLVPAPDDYSAGLRAAARDLTTPAGAALKPVVFRDPPAHREALMARLETAGPGMALDMSAGTLLSEDGAHALILAEPAARALDVAEAQATLDLVSAATPEGFTVRPLGAHVFATAAAASIKRDVHVTVAATIVAVLLFFVLVFRRFGAVWPLFLPVLAGGAAAIGVTGWIGRPVHGITLAFGAVVVGVAIDYGTHLVVHLRARLADHPDEGFAASLTRAYTEVAGGLTVAAGTTLVACGALAVAGNAALRAFARVAALGIGAAFLFTLLVLPLLLRPSVGATRARALAPKLGRGAAWAILAGVLLVTGLLAPGLLHVRFDGDPRNLDHQPDEVRALEREFGERYRHPRSPTLVVAPGEDAEEALQKAERVAAVLGRARAAGDIGAYTSLAGVLPSERTQLANLATWRTEQRPAIERAAAAVGMRPEVFAPFHEDLQRLLDAPRPVRAADLKGTPLERLVGRLLIEDDEGFKAMTVVYLTGTGHRSVPPEVLDELRVIPGVSALSAAGVAAQAVEGIKGSLGRLVGVSVALVLLLLATAYRRLTPMLAAVLPVGLAIVWTWGLMGRFDVPLNLVSIGAFGLVCGLGVDYGVFVTNASLHGAAPAARASVVLAACTTVLGFAALLLADSPVMWSLGFAVTAGVVSALVGAALVLPAVWTVLGAPTGRREPRWPTLGLAGLLGLAALVVVSRITGYGSDDDRYVAGVLLVDVACAAALVYRMRRHPRDQEAT